MQQMGHVDKIFDPILHVSHNPRWSEILRYASIFTRCSRHVAELAEKECNQQPQYARERRFNYIRRTFGDYQIISSQLHGTWLQLTSHSILNRRSPR